MRRLLRRLLVFPVLGMILLGLIGLRQAALNWHPVLSGEPGALLYVAAFDDFTDEWQQYQGVLEAQVVDGALRIGADDVDKLPYSVAQPYFSDFDLRMQARPLAGPENNGYGVVFRLQDPDNLYWFLISSDGYYSLYRKANGLQKKLSDWIASPPINTGLDVTNTIRVIAAGQHFRFLVNDQPVQLCVPDSPEGESTYSRGECVQGKMVDTLVDDSLAAGQLGAAVLTLDEPGVIVEFDNLVVLAPQVVGETGS